MQSWDSQQIHTIASRQNRKRKGSQTRSRKVTQLLSFFAHNFKVFCLQLIPCKMYLHLSQLSMVKRCQTHWIGFLRICCRFQMSLPNELCSIQPPMRITPCSLWQLWPCSDSFSQYWFLVSFLGRKTWGPFLWSSLCAAHGGVHEGNSGPMSSSELCKRHFPSGWRPHIKCQPGFWKGCFWTSVFCFARWLALKSMRWDRCSDHNCQRQGKLSLQSYKQQKIGGFWGWKLFLWLERKSDHFCHAWDRSIP